MKKVSCVLTLLGIWVLMGPMHADCRAAAVRQANLAEIARDAEIIFVVFFFDARLAYDEQAGRQAWFFSFTVLEMLKGPDSDTITVKLNKTLVDMKQVKTYVPGEEVVLFLAGESRLGYSSPIGLAQGRFRIRYDISGAKTVTNGFNNRKLFRGMTNVVSRHTVAGPADRESVSGLLNQKQGPVAYRLFRLLTKAVLFNLENQQQGKDIP
ncbi:MAG: hypothetical protein GY868_13045 [Deltaproteobacteria bacterium]|nr:hypothetical protein [Deltaproteobacteria bacterium]